MVEPCENETGYTAKCAIIMAAGIGERMRPVTQHTPKPLVAVHNCRMIDTIIEALHENGITEIYVVVGYLKEQFLSLSTQYPGVQLIENPDYDKANNISSLYYAREHLGNCIILDGDQIIKDPKILNSRFQRSGYCCCWVSNPSQEWILTLNNGVVSSCSRKGGMQGWELHSVSFWTQADGERLRRHLEVEYKEKHNSSIYWDDIALFCYPDEYHLGVIPIARDALIEIDTYEDLIRLDPSYQ